MVWQELPNQALNIPYGTSMVATILQSLLIIDSVITVGLKVENQKPGKPTLIRLLQCVIAHSVAPNLKAIVWMRWSKMKINKQQWAGIESALKSGAPVSFLYLGHEIKVMKITVSETRMAYVLTQNGHALTGFLNKEHKDYNPLSEVFLRKRLINPYARVARSIAKERGGKSYLKRKENRYLTERSIEVIDTFFPTAKTVVAHFRKIKELELATGTFVSLNSATGGHDA